MGKLESKCRYLLCRQEVFSDGYCYSHWEAVLNAEPISAAEAEKQLQKFAQGEAMLCRLASLEKRVAENEKNSRHAEPYKLPAQEEGHAEIAKILDRIEKATVYGRELPRIAYFYDEINKIRKEYGIDQKGE